MGIINIIKKRVSGMNKTGKDWVSYKNTYAAISLIRVKTENRIFIFSTLVSLIFLGFYGYLIYLNIDVYSLRHIIVYSILSALLIISLAFNVLFHPIKKQKMGNRQKNKRKKILDVEKNIIMLIQTLTKITSLGYMLFEIITIDSSIKRVLPFALSTLALVFQIIVTYISRLVVSYYDILMIGINNDIKSSGIINVLADQKVLKDPLYVNVGVGKSKAGKISNDINNQVDNNKDVSDKNKKDYLYGLAKYCLENPRKREDVINHFDLPPSIADNQLKKISDLGIIKVNANTTIDMLITDLLKIEEVIYK